MFEKPKPRQWFRVYERGQFCAHEARGGPFLCTASSYAQVDARDGQGWARIFACARWYFEVVPSPRTAGTVDDN